MDPFGINKLIDLLVEFIWWFVPCTVIDHFERGVVLRFGKFNRVLEPGFHWMWPFGVEQVLSENVKPDGSYTVSQAVTLKDGTSLALTLIFIWEIVDIKKLLLEIEDKETVLTWALGHVEDFIHRLDWSELIKLRAWAAESGKRHGISEKFRRHINDMLEEDTGVHFADIKIRDLAITGTRNGVFRIVQ
jgi:regulator of protease activity HflC (stomatin/prohibitin superfamily)